MGEFIVDNIVIHAGDNDLEDAREPLHFLPGAVLLDDSQHEIRVLRKPQDRVLDEGVAIVEAFILEQHALGADILIDARVYLDQIAVIVLQGIC